MTEERCITSHLQLRAPVLTTKWERDTLRHMHYSCQSKSIQAWCNKRAFLQSCSVSRWNDKTLPGSSTPTSLLLDATFSAYPWTFFLCPHPIFPPFVNLLWFLFVLLLQPPVAMPVLIHATTAEFHLPRPLILLFPCWLSPSGVLAVQRGPGRLSTPRGSNGASGELSNH